MKSQRRCGKGGHYENVRDRNGAHRSDDGRQRAPDRAGIGHRYRSIDSVEGGEEMYTIRIRQSNVVLQFNKMTDMIQAEELLLECGFIQDGGEEQNLSLIIEWTPPKER